MVHPAAPPRSSDARLPRRESAGLRGGTAGIDQDESLDSGATTFLASRQPLDTEDPAPRRTGHHAHRRRNDGPPVGAWIRSATSPRAWSSFRAVPPVATAQGRLFHARLARESWLPGRPLRADQALIERIRRTRELTPAVAASLPTPMASQVAHTITRFGAIQGIRSSCVGTAHGRIHRVQPFLELRHRR